MNKLLYILIALTALTALTACKSKQVVKQVENTQTEVREVQAVTTELKTDSTRHVYTIEHIKVYAPDTGNLLREEKRQSGDVQTTTNSESQESSKDTQENINTEKQLDNEKAKGSSAPTPSSTIVNNRINKVARILAIAGVVALVIYITRSFYVRK